MKTNAPGQGCAGWISGSGGWRKPTPDPRPPAPQPGFANGLRARCSVWMIVVLVTSFALCSCRSADQESSNVSPLTVSVIGIDGATWKVIDPLLARGKVPNLARLIERGVRTPLHSQAPLLSPAVWTTLATGVSRKVHGIRNFTKHGRLISSLDRQVPSLWSIASSSGKRAAVIGWWGTYPAEEIHGAIISERALKIREQSLHDLFSDIGIHQPDDKLLVSPPSALAMMRPLLDRVPTTPKGSPGYRFAIDDMTTEDTAVAQGLLELRKKMGPFDLEMILMRGVDVISHFYWKFHEPDSPAYTEEERPRPREVKQFGSVIDDYYSFVDGLVGDVVSPEPNHVTIILSDHGFEAGSRPQRGGGSLVSGKHESSAAMDGILIAAGGPFRTGATLEKASILDITPTVLYLLGQPVAKYMEGTVLTSAIRPDWLDSHPVRKTERYPGPPVLLAGMEAGKGEENTGSSVDDAVLEQLRALGYIE